MTIDTSTLIASADKLHKCVDKNEEREQGIKDKLLYDTIKAKVTKKKHSFITLRDRTFKKCENLLKNSADPSKLKLSEEDYYSKFLKRLNNIVQKSRSIPQTVKIPVKKIISQITVQSEESYCNAIAKKQADSMARKESYDSGIESGYESDGNSATADDKHSADDTTLLIAQPNSKNTHFEESISKEKTLSVKKKFRGIRKKVHGGFKRATRVWKRIEKSVISEKKEENTTPLSFPNLCYNPADAGNKNNSAPISKNAEKQIRNEIKNDSNCLLEAIQKKDQKQFKDHLESGADIIIKDGEGNNILYLIASLKKKQKCEFLDALIEKTPVENLAQLINSQDKDGKTPLQIALITKIEKEKHTPNKPRDGDNTLKFIRKLLEFGADSNQLELSKEDLKELSEKQKEYYRHFLEKFAKSGIKSDIKTKIEEAIANTINIKDSNGSYPLHLAIHNDDQKLFEELLQKGADITSQDKEGDNVLHRIALLKGKQKVTYLKLILNLQKIPEDKLSEAIKARNSDEYTPIQLALINKIQKEKHNHINPKSRDNTIKFCAMLLQNGAKPSDLKLTKKLHNKEHYRFLCKLEKCGSVPQEIKERITDIRKGFKSKYGYQSKTKKFFKSAWEFMDPARRTRELLVITATITVITMVAFAFFQGQMAIEAAIPIIAVAGVICLIFTLVFSPIKKFFKKSSANEQNTSSTENHARSITEQNQTSNNDQQNLGNNSENLAVQEPPAQLECEQNNPNTKINDLSIMGQFVNSVNRCLGFSIG